MEGVPLLSESQKPAWPARPASKGGRRRDGSSPPSRSCRAANSVKFLVDAQLPPTLVRWIASHSHRRFLPLPAKSRPRAGVCRATGHSHRCSLPLPARHERGEGWGEGLPYCGASYRLIATVAEQGRWRSAYRVRSGTGRLEKAEEILDYWGLDLGKAAGPSLLRSNSQTISRINQSVESLG